MRQGLESTRNPVQVQWSHQQDLGQFIFCQVLDQSDGRVMGVEVTAWIVDVATLEREPIVVGTGLTDGEGIVEFTYVAANQPYVCGYEVRDPTSLVVLARHPASVSNHLSNPSGLGLVALPVSGG